MSDLFLRWLGLSRRLQGALCFIMTCLFAGLFWGGWASAVYQQRAAISQATQQETRHYVAALSTLRSGEPLSRITDEISHLKQQLAQADANAFSLPEMLRQAGGELESWQPDRQGGTLQLEVNWAQFQSLFHYFHQHAPAVALPQFQLKREQDALRLQLSLVFNHER